MSEGECLEASFTGSIGSGDSAGTIASAGRCESGRAIGGDGVGVGGKDSSNWSYSSPKALDDASRLARDDSMGSRTAIGGDE